MLLQKSQKVDLPNF